MRIGVIHWAFPPTIGGVETHLATLYPELVRMGHKVFLLTEDLDGKEGKDEYEGIELERTKLMSIPTFEKRDSEFYEIVENMIREWIDNVKPDIVHAHNLNCFFHYHPAACEKICKEKKIPLILTVHQVWKNNPNFVKLTTKTGWNRIIAVSKFVKKELKEIGVSEGKIDVVYHGLDKYVYKPRSKAELKSLFSKYPRFRNKKIILHPARVSEGKGNHISVKAMSLVKEKFPDTMLVLTGMGKEVSFFKDDKYKNEILKLIKKLELEENVFKGDFTWNEMLMLYSASEIVIYPTVGSREKGNEAFGLATIEANSSGKPIIVSTSGALPELIRNGFNGWVIPKNNPEKLAERINYFLGNDKIREKVGMNGRKNVKNNFTIEAMARNTVKVYRKLL